MQKKLLFIQPIVSHYRKSVIEEITKLEPLSIFWGTSNFQGVAPLIGVTNVDNSLETTIHNFFGIKFVWYKRLFRKVIKHESSHVVLSGINPLLIQTLLIFIYVRFFTQKKIYWWSQGKKFNQGLLGKRLRLFFYKYADGIFLYSQMGKENFIAEGVPKEKLHVINNCLNYEDYGWLNYPLYSAYKSAGKRDFRILYTGRLSKRKKVEILIEALGVLKTLGADDIYLDIIGDGEQMDFLIEKASQIGVDSFVIFHGSKYGKEIHSHFLNSNLVVCPGAVGLSIVHSFSFGLPIITGKNDEGHSSELELLKQGVNGDFFDLDSSESLAMKIAEWRDRIQSDENIIKRACIDSIIEYDYLPSSVARRLVEAL